MPMNPAAPRTSKRPYYWVGPCFFHADFVERHEGAASRDAARTERISKVFAPQGRNQHMANAAKPATKSDILKSLTDNTGLSKKDVVGILDGLTDLIKRELGKKGPGMFTIPGLIKLKLVHKPATK